MNATNRALNRAVLLIVGLILLVVGGAVAAAALVPAWLAAWIDAAERLDLSFDPRQFTTLTIALGACAVVIALLVVFVVRQGRGHTRTLVRTDDSGGSIVVDTRVAASLIEAAVAESPSVASVSVSGYRVRGVPALKIAVSPRRGASPSVVRDAVDLVVERWDDVLGSEVAVLVTVA